MTEQPNDWKAYAETIRAKLWKRVGQASIWLLALGDAVANDDYDAFLAVLADMQAEESEP